MPLRIPLVWRYLAGMPVTQHHILTTPKTRFTLSPLMATTTYLPRPRYLVTKSSAIPAEALQFLDFVNASPSPFHAVHEAAQRLRKAGFVELKERSDWEGVIQLSGKYYFTRNASSIVAFAVGGEYKSGNGFSIVGAHTDSPCLKVGADIVVWCGMVKPISKKEREGYLEVGCELYGGGLWHTWFDRDLSVAGRVFVEHDDGTHHNTLVRIDRPILRIPSLAIHLDRSANEAFKFNTESQLTPVLATAAKTALTGNPKDEETISGAERKHHPLLIKILAEELEVAPSKIKDFELCLFDTQGSVIGGANYEFIFSARLDNLEMSFCSLTVYFRSLPHSFFILSLAHDSTTTQALINSSDDISSDPNIRIIALFDNEEVGSVTAHGAGSDLLPVTLRRLAATRIGEWKPSPTAYEEALQKSYLISADMAHAVHPNYRSVVCGFVWIDGLTFPSLLAVLSLLSARSMRRITVRKCTKAL
ncbi:aminopeptidase I zinc metalloprotease-domain-containing protein [Endogone sp. FLAS-F59071]|nr:aminopeptidase I zinc metalloprotease-domain-containing protein [Endogone sp. FLAS-F59071]|eukprot:RUS19472.1 aminopeptidase I zinc metalloprotease-domain-containing protein [Endogone sp. FLAS-F59071]